MYCDSIVMNLSALSKLGNLRRLCIAGVTHVKDVNFFTDLPNLQHVTLPDMEAIDDAGALRALKKLRRVIVSRQLSTSISGLVDPAKILVTPKGRAFPYRPFFYAHDAAFLWS